MDAAGRQIVIKYIHNLYIQQLLRVKVMSIDKNITEELSAFGTVTNRGPLRFHTTYRIGGEADYYIRPNSVEDLKEVIRILDEN